ncbi:23S rRNA (adenine(1618)-N(6))-methyltransferase RlmF [Gillisia sp. M10.2A]|uniref:Ribosomal RNA large subunit methyltransferase F n=1 Tax=Gillisia lutea TaxID=2909668 RepID=A0ABS9EJB7_9FLAO|nr:23S rRNA (adenine(1618)-N(6))-methyltransferase RlmF [Gillisia lutea]MCF4101551.1 23S rRNA (adenine(1618)-N(6))-methyltransferase RlmF [Gillisia lutea]
MPHPKNILANSYDFTALIKSHKPLGEYVSLNAVGNKSIDFADSKAVLQLNKALLKHHYQLVDWEIPENYLCPPIPGRADYIHHIYDLLAEDNIKMNVKGLDIGVGANCIYPILGAKIYNWKMFGADIDENAIAAATANVKMTPGLKKLIEIRQQDNNANIFGGIIKEGEYFNFSMCNPPFHPSEEAAKRGTFRKLKNLGQSNLLTRNFGGQANELWCNGGEALFIKRMIKESVNFKTQVGWFTSLVSKKENLAKIYKQLDRLKVTHKTIEMEQGNKRSRFIAWKFEN